MAEEVKTAEVLALEAEIKKHKEAILKLSAYKEMLDTEKALRKEDQQTISTLEGKVMRFEKWLEDFSKYGDSDYKGKFIAEEGIKLLKKKIPEEE